MAFVKTIRRESPPPYRKEVFGILFFAFGFFISLCLISYHPTDPGFNASSSVDKISNLGGVIGAYLSDLLFTTFGLCAYAVGGLFFLLSMLKFKGETFSLTLKESLYYSLLLFCAATLLQLHFPEVTISGQSFAGGGILGALFGQFLVHYLNSIGAKIVAITGLILSFILATHLKISALFLNSYRLLRYFGFHLTQWGRVSFERGKRGVSLFCDWLKGHWISIFTRETVEKEGEVKIHQPKPALTPVLVEGDPKPLEKEGALLPPVHKGGLKIYEREDGTKKSFGDGQLHFLKISGGGFSPPPLSLLDSEDQKSAPVEEELLRKSANLLEKKLLDYDVQGRVTEIHPGPVITMYEFEPATGTKINKIVNLESDLSLTMGGKSIRIVPHIPGKAALGIEIPNHTRETVWLKEIVSSNIFQKTKSRLTLSLGKDIKGRPMVTDLTKMPHLLIAGATGSGKSVCLNAMLVSMLFKASPQEVRLILVDPKRLELNIYEGIPHLLLPVVTEPKRAVTALKWAVHEMERRYRLLADVGTRNITTYNEKIDNQQIALIPEEEAKERLNQDKEAICHTGKLYYLVIVIDELADLMMVATQEFEETITRLAQMARAAGIHLVLATQRPSVDVITGLIKANFPARISFKVSSKYDSRTILDQIGAETLLGAGDMLFMPPAASNLVRIHGALVTESEITRITSYLKEQATPVFDPTLLEASMQKNSEVGEELDEEEGEMYDKAVELVAQTRQASISMIQRRLRIGYNRAARMMEKMEQEGVVSPQDGAKPREVLIQSIEGNQS